MSRTGARAPAPAVAASVRTDTPLIQMPDGVIVNAPHLLNNTGKADKVVSIDLVNGTVTYRETNAFQGGDPIKYISTESSNPVAATLENATFAPALDALPTRRWRSRRLERSQTEGEGEKFPGIWDAVKVVRLFRETGPHPGASYVATRACSEAGEPHDEQSDR